MLLSGRVCAQPEIYTQDISLITGIWTGNCTVSEVSNEDPFDGTEHYRIDYSATGWWSGWGMNMNNWGSAPAIDFSAYDAIQISYRGLSGSAVLVLQLRDADGLSTQVEVGGMTAEYTTVVLPLSLFLAGTPVDITRITELTFSTANNVETYSGTVFIDGIILTTGTFEGKTTLQTWSRHARMGKGVNFANWLEAYWLIPFNAFPETDRYNREVVQNLFDMGFSSVRLPVCFERIANPNPPFTIPPDHIVFDLIDSTIAWAQEMGFNLIITNHHGIEITNANYPDEIVRKRAIWQQVLNRYGDLDPETHFFEIFNEPTLAVSNANLHILMDSVLAVMREEVPGHTIIIGGNSWNSINGLLNTQPYADSNLIYTFHSYDPFAFTHQGMSWTDPPYLPPVPFPNGPDDSPNLVQIIESAAIYSNVFNVPVMLGEFGCSTAADAQSRCNYIDVIGQANDAYDMPWYYWDVISPADAFGFLDNNGEPIPCFANALKLGDADTCSLLVSETTDSGPGSLREVLACAASGDTVYFDTGLSGDTIKLTGLPVFFNSNIRLINTGPGKIVLDIDAGSTLVFIAPDVEVHLENLTLLIRDARAIHNAGDFRLRNCELHVLTQEPVHLSSGILRVGENVIIAD